MTGKSIELLFFLRGFRRNGHFGISRQGKVFFRRQQRAKRPQTRQLAEQRVVSRVFTFPLRVAGFSILSACCGSGFFSPLSSHHPPLGDLLFVSRCLLPSVATENTSTLSRRQTARRRRRTERSRGSFRGNFSQGNCAMLSNLFLFFLPAPSLPPGAIADFLSEEV